MDLTRVGQANTLRYLDIRQTIVALLNGIGKIGSSMQVLRADRTDIGGRIPEDLYELENLQFLSLSECGLSGELHDAIGNLTELHELYLYGNQFRGQIPESIGNMQKLRVLSMASNSFTGTLPESLNDMPRLRALSLADQRAKGGTGIGGPLISFPSNKQLFMISLKNNIIEGGIPNDFLQSAATDRFYSIDLGGNLLTGNVPGTLARFDQMEIFLEDNQFSQVDSTLCDKQNWMSGNVKEFGCDAILCPKGTVLAHGRREFEDLQCKDCTENTANAYFGRTVCGKGPIVMTERDSLIYFFQTCDGIKWTKKDNWQDEDQDICDWYGIECNDYGSVVSISLGANNVICTIPAELYNLPNLEKLSFHSNPGLVLGFEGIEHARKLQILHLDSTGMTSVSGISKARNLRQLDLRFNNLSGRFPAEIYSLVKLRDLLLSDNKFTGPLPNGFDKVTNLAALLLGNNQFTGTLPDYQHLPNLVFLDVSRNRLKGPIPTTLMKSVKTVPKSGETIFIDVSGNSLTGTVPQELQRLQNLQLHVKNNKFSAISEELCALDSWNKGDAAKYGCNGIMCPAGTYNEIGRQSSDDTPCEPCSIAKYMGSAECRPGMNAGGQRSVAWGTTLLLGAISLAAML